MSLNIFCDFWKFGKIFRKCKLWWKFDKNWAKLCWGISSWIYLHTIFVILHSVWTHTQIIENVWQYLWHHTLVLYWLWRMWRWWHHLLQGLLFHRISLKLYKLVSGCCDGWSCKCPPQVLVDRTSNLKSFIREMILMSFMAMKMVVVTSRYCDYNGYDGFGNDVKVSDKDG